MADELNTAAGTEPGSTSGNQGSGAPTDAPAAKVTFTQEQYDTALAKMRRAAEAEFARKRDAEWATTLGVTSLGEAAERLKQVAEPAPKTKTEVEIVAEKITADFQRKLAEKEKALAEAQTALQAEAQRRTEEQLRSYMLQHVADTTDPALAMAVFGVPYKASREIRIVEGKPVVVEDGTELHHIQPDQYIKELLGKPEYGFLRKPTSVGTGARPNGTTPSPAPKPQRTDGRKLSQQELIDQAVAAGIAHVTSGSGR